MTDLALNWLADAFSADLVVARNDLDLTEDIQAAVIISLFTDRRAPAGEPVDDADRRGWWGDTFPEIEDDELGSLLWLLKREKQTQATLERAQVYARQALQWLVDDRIARRVDVLAEYPQRGLLALTVTIRTMRRQTVRLLFELGEQGNWTATDDAGVPVPIGCGEAYP